MVNFNVYMFQWGNFKKENKTKKSDILTMKCIAALYMYVIIYWMKKQQLHILTFLKVIESMCWKWLKIVYKYAYILNVCVSCWHHQRHIHSIVYILNSLDIWIEASISEWQFLLWNVAFWKIVFDEKPKFESLLIWWFML